MPNDREIIIIYRTIGILTFISQKIIEIERYHVEVNARKINLLLEDVEMMANLKMLYLCYYK